MLNFNMIRKKQLSYILNNKKILKFFLYVLCFLTFSSIVYFSIPKLFNYSLQSIEENLKYNNNISIKNITDINIVNIIPKIIRFIKVNLFFKAIKMHEMIVR